ncbi:MAG TPA: GNAT family N-acetyltransferase [Candidatus Kapabacteria bacterium]|nr:GNAT family N-acetyltransferase [Candidatus Kapabacteria bacterium]
MWQPTSLFLRSEFIFWREHSIIEDVGDALVITTPENPFWRWGNLIVLKEWPRPEQAERWRALHAERIAPHQPVRNRLLVWEGIPDGRDVLEPYLAGGLTFSTFDVLRLQQLRKPANYRPEIIIRAIADTDEVWRSVISMNVESFGIRYDDPDYQHFAEQRIAHHRAMVRKGMGHWYGAYVNGELAGSLGIFWGDGLCRFQEVAVRPQFRRQGIAATLVYEAAKNALRNFPNFPQVIAADGEGDAIRIYRALGFETDSRSFALREHR